MIEVMKIVNTHGVKGQLKAVYFADSPEFFEDVNILCDQKGNEYKITDVKEHKGALLLNIEGIDDMDKAQKLKGLSLFARREDFPPLPEGEYYLTDLYGLKAVVDGNIVGEVIDIVEKAQNIIVIRKTNGEEAMVPQCDAFVKSVDVNDGKIYLTPIEGLI